MLENESTAEQPKKVQSKFHGFRPTSAFIGASWASLGIGLIAYCIGLWNSNMELNEQGYYFTIILFGLFSVISVQKCVRDKSEGIEDSKQNVKPITYSVVKNGLIDLWEGVYTF